jgi:hypothetical protein
MAGKQGGALPLSSALTTAATFSKGERRLDLMTEVEGLLK